MKKTLIILGVVIVGIVLGIFLLNNTVKKPDFNKIETTFLINYNKEKVLNSHVYYGNNTYYILEFQDKDKETYTAVLNNKEKLVYQVKKSEIKKIKKTGILGFKDEKLIYETKEKNKNGYVYYYYDALTGEFINKVNMNK